MPRLLSCTNPLGVVRGGRFIFDHECLVVIPDELRDNVLLSLGRFTWPPEDLSQSPHEAFGFNLVVFKDAADIDGSRGFGWFGQRRYRSTFSVQSLLQFVVNRVTEDINQGIPDTLRIPSPSRQ